MSPLSTRVLKATRGSAFLPVMTESVALPSGLHGRDTFGGGVDIVLLALDADEVPAEALGDRPVVPEPKNGSSTTSPGLVEAIRMRASSASGFCVGCTFLPSSPFSRSEPEQMGNSQSERI